MNYVVRLAMGLLLLVSGCVSTKVQRKPDEIIEGPSIDAKERSLIIFKEGAALLNEDPRAAAVKFSQARELDPSNIPAWYNEGVAHELNGDAESALKSYQGCLAIDKEQAACLANLLMVHVSLNKAEEAKMLLDSYLAEYSEKPFALVAAAKYYLSEHNLAEAEHYARAAIEREADNVEALYVMARIFYEKKEYSAAKWVLKNTLENAPAHGGMHLLLGHVYVALAEFHDALDSYRLAVKYYPSEEALENYGLMLLKRGRVKEALFELQRLVARAPHVFQHQLHVGNAYMANKQFAESEAAYLEALKLNPEEKDINFNLGLLYFDLKPEGLSELERLKTAERSFKTYLEIQGLSEERIKEVKGYLKVIEQKIELEEYAIESAKEEKTEAEPAPEEQPAQEEALPQEHKEESLPPAETNPAELPEPIHPEPKKPEDHEPKALPKKKGQDELDEIDDELLE